MTSASAFCIFKFCASNFSEPLSRPGKLSPLAGAGPASVNAPDTFPSVGCQPVLGGKGNSAIFNPVQFNCEFRTGLSALSGNFPLISKLLPQIAP